MISSLSQLSQRLHPKQSRMIAAGDAYWLKVHELRLHLVYANNSMTFIVKNHDNWTVQCPELLNCVLLFHIDKPTYKVNMNSILLWKGEIQLQKDLFYRRMKMNKNIVFGLRHKMKLQQYLILLYWQEDSTKLCLNIKIDKFFWI